MIKKPYVKIVILVGMFASVCYWNSIKTTEQPGVLVLQNIEALAGNENFPAGTDCIGSGSVDCPINSCKVKYVIEGYSLGE